MLAALIVLGCSTVKFAYDNVDWVLLSKADDYLNLTDAQRVRAKQLVAARMQVHRREELPIYVATLKEVRAMLADELSPTELAIIKKRIPALYRRTMRKMKINTHAWSQMVLDLDATLDERQRQHLLDKLDLFIEELGELSP